MQKSTEINNLNYEAWHHYSQINYEASLYYSNKFTTETEDKCHILSRLGLLPQKYVTRRRLHMDFGHNYLPLITQKKVHELKEAI